MPQFIQRYFWDVSQDSIDIQTHSGFIIQRVLELGDIESVKWVFNTYPSDQIKHTLTTKKIDSSTKQLISHLIKVNKL